MEKTNQKNNPTITIAVAVVVALISFFAGTKFQQSKTPSPQDLMAQRVNSQPRGGGQIASSGFRPINGTVLSLDDNSLTVKLTDGSSKIVILTDDTQINKASVASLQDLVEGETVNLFGSVNSDGTVTAQSIQVGIMSRINKD